MPRTQNFRQAHWLSTRAVIRALVRRVEIDRDYIKIIFRVPPPTDSGDPQSSGQTEGNLLSGKIVQPVVKHTHSRLNRFRSILIRWTKKPANYLAMIHIACGVITWRAALSR